MESACLKFLLLPDASAARRTRRLLAERGYGVGVGVGTWTELLEACRVSYIPVLPPCDWDERFANATRADDTAFWHGSLAVAPKATRAAVYHALLDLMTTREPDAPPVDPDSSQLSARARMHLADLQSLTTRLAGAIPPHLALVRAILEQPAADARPAILPHAMPGLPWLNVWQERLIDKLCADAGQAPDPILLEMLAASLTPPSNAKPASLLRTVQDGLYGGGKTMTGPDDGTIQVLAARDPLHEAEIAAGITQHLLAARDDVTPADIGILIPDDADYAMFLADTFGVAGLALSGLARTYGQRDLGYEAVYQFLLICRGATPGMVRAALLSSPLMPAEEHKTAERMSSLVAQRPAKDAAAVLRRLSAFAAMLNDDEALAMHRERAWAAINIITPMLDGRTDMDWPALLAAIGPEALSTEAETLFVREGVTVLREGHEPWRATTHLLVLGFTQGRYPAVPPVSSVFAPEDLARLRDHAGFAIRLPGELLTERRGRFRRQIGTATRSLTLLTPRRDTLGQGLVPSDSLIFLHAHVDSVAKAEDWIRELDRFSDRKRAVNLPVAPKAPAQPPREIVSGDLDFGRNILVIRKDADGKMRRESPSSLETLTVSPLAWLLYRLGAEPTDWAPDCLDAALRGTIAHYVFEHLFTPEGELPTVQDIAVRVPTLLKEALTHCASFLLGSEWALECGDLEREFTVAATAWRDLLVRMGGEILATELWLSGKRGSLPIGGKADAVIGFPGNRVAVVDYKGASAPRRLTRMEAGYDSQIELYRQMLEKGDRQAGPDLEKRLAGVKEFGALYYMLKDTIVLANNTVMPAEPIPQWRAVNGDVSSAAMQLIDERLRDLRAGWVPLNRVGDAEFFQQEAGLTPYALDGSPLIDLFMLADEE